VIEALLQTGLIVLVISPNQVKNLRSPVWVGRQQGRPVRHLPAR
jgi:hypothetical protein